MKERGVAGEGLLSYALYAHDGAPLAAGTPRPAGYVRVNPVASTVDQRSPRHRAAGAEHLDAPRHDLRWREPAVLRQRRARRDDRRAAADTSPCNNGAIRIGGNASSTGEFFNGLIDEVRVYNRALSAAEIATDMTTAIVR